MATTKKQYGSTSFATFLIIGPTCFFLGILFAFFPYDYPLLWTSAPIPDEYYGHVETHVRFVYESPPLIGRLLSTIILVGFLGFFIKLFNPSEANVLFDGASLILYMIGVGVYLTNIVKGLRAVGNDIWNRDDWQEKRLLGDLMLGKEDSLRVMAASNTILALVLVGVLVLQAGQWYAESKEKEEWEKMEAEDRDQAAAAAAAAAAAGAGAASAGTGKGSAGSTATKKKQ
ncbi:Shr3 amino acid permease chaperone [Sodiomyces alkalinus F11]|uniref:Shr3 amino acid permease chaperone n=1 Tax=Sodiomyces alkalinus (strain CBS 110278 / VKM F-3762 / F11) TaxID=1314773 RepID=A0A3N2PL66_SODAK|nr:Shr3 amino acid permease chaperone [Sodiomyces alkalinus F11]ROT35265.1 Shr3 amino acid permease chaperone [Sodiomyces alkalinus F11]